MLQAMINAARKAFEPGSCLGGHAGDNLRNRAPDVEGSHQSVEAKPETADHLADTSLREAPHQLHLPKPQMRMNDAQSGGEIVIRLRFDERDLVIVPED